MFELTINGTVYQFNFGMGFMRDINGTLKKPIDGVPGAKEDIGMQYKIAGVLAGDVGALAEVLYIANKGFDPRLNYAELDKHLEKETTDIDELFDKVIGFLRVANVTKKVTERMEKALKQQETKTEA